MPSGTKLPSQTFSKAVASIDREAAKRRAAPPKVAPMSSEIDRSEKTEVTPESADTEVPVVESDVVSADNGTGTTSWQDKINQIKKQKEEAAAAEAEGE